MWFLPYSGTKREFGISAANRRPSSKGILEISVSVKHQRGYVYLCGKFRDIEIKKTFQHARGVFRRARDTLKFIKPTGFLGCCLRHKE